MPRIKIEKRFYVYVLFDEGDESETPFYVGKGMNDRVFAHQREAASGHDCRKCRRIREIWEAGRNVGVELVFQTDFEDIAFEYEIELIKRYGTVQLCNRTAGGGGGKMPADVRYGRELQKEQHRKASKKRKETKTKWIDLVPRSRKKPYKDDGHGTND